MPRVVPILIVAALLTLPAVAALPPAARPLWAAVQDATVALAPGAPFPDRASGLGPGTHLLIEIEGDTFTCSSGWIFRDARGYLLSAAGHCFLPEGTSATVGLGAYDASAVAVRACVADCDFGGETGFTLTGTTVALGRVEYARQRTGTALVGHDFGLVRVPDALVPELRAALPVWGQASRVRDVLPGDITCFYGNGVATGETFPTMARAGAGVVTLSDGSWRMAAPSMQGDSGAAVATCTEDGRALAAVGTLTHLAGGLIAGTTVARSQQLAAEAGLVVAPWLG